MSSTIRVISPFKHDDLIVHSAEGVEKAVGCAGNYKAVIFYIKRALTLFVGTAKLFCDHHSSFCETPTLHKRETATY